MDGPLDGRVDVCSSVIDTTAISEERDKAENANSKQVRDWENRAKEGADVHREAPSKLVSGVGERGGASGGEQSGSGLSMTESAPVSSACGAAHEEVVQVPTSRTTTLSILQDLSEDAEGMGLRESQVGKEEEEEEVETQSAKLSGRWDEAEDSAREHQRQWNAQKSEPGEGREVIGNERRGHQSGRIVREEMARCTRHEANMFRTTRSVDDDEAMKKDMVLSRNGLKGGVRHKEGKDWEKEPVDGAKESEGKECKLGEKIPHKWSFGFLKRAYGLSPSHGCETPPPSPPSKPRGRSSKRVRAAGCQTCGKLRATSQPPLPWVCQNCHAINYGRTK
ncbi:hypothetical protein CBR_g38637 [Chara braunii]|uniref:Uncharacterized protein n=1 Tax=Chara braunii TaxID=69332 RepID=A0A388K0I2_CHABU|nr:hypothetical protein CBR_g38637 [Chara braunii]|eukprot:GBG63571.1 hypothetical protein CBR_g38637 [Chara braunii]